MARLVLQLSRNLQALLMVLQRLAVLAKAIVHDAHVTKRRALARLVLQLSRNLQALLIVLQRLAVLAELSVHDAHVAKCRALARLVSFDHARGRYVVELDGNGGTQKHKMKPENLAPCTGRTGGKRKTKQRPGAK